MSRIAMLLSNEMRADARVDREAAALAAAGHDVTVFALRSPAAPELEQRAGFAISRVADYTTAGWTRPWAKLSQSRTRSRRLAEAAAAIAPDVVHAHDTDTLAAAASAASTSGARLVYDAHELYPDMLQEHGLSGSVPVQAYWRSVERRCVPRADAVITVSDGLAETLAYRYGCEPVVVANVPALEPLGDRRRLRAELGLQADSPVAIYQGVLIQGRGLDRLVRAMVHVPGTTLAVQGFGPAEAAMREAAVAAGVQDRVRFMGRIAPAELHDYACGADLGVVIYEHTTLNNYLAAPNKLYAYLMAGIAIASSDFPGLASVVEGEHVGATFDPSSESSIAETLRTTLNDSGNIHAMGARARELAESRYNWDAEKLKLLGVYDRLATPSTSDRRTP